MAETAVLDSAETHDEVERALATGLIGMDTARRVGWAKAFDALRRVEVLEEQVRQKDDELKYLRRAYSRLLGFAWHTTPRTDVSRQELNLHRAAQQTFQSEGDWNTGRELADQHLAEQFGIDETTRRRRRDRAAAQKVWRARMYRELLAAGREAGHRTSLRRKPPTDSGDVNAAVVCSCGERFLGPENDAYHWRHAHLSLSLSGSESGWLEEWKCNNPFDADGRFRA